MSHVRLSIRYNLDLCFVFCLYSIIIFYRIKKYAS